MVPLGGIHPAARTLDAIELSVHDGLPAIGLLRDVVQQVTAERKGVALVGPKGCGKSVALARVKAEFDAGEDEKHQRDDTYLPQHLLVLQCLRTGDARQVLGLIYRAATGNEQPRRGRHGPKPIEQLRREVVEQLRQLNIVALLLDEADKLPPAGLQVIRDLMAQAEESHPDRHTARGYRAVGLGVVFLGEPMLEIQLRQSGEVAQRFTRVVRIPPVEPAAMPALYAALHESMAHAAERLGARWTTLITSLWNDRPVPARLIENHVRQYLRVRFNEQVARDPSRAADLGLQSFDEDLFVAAHEWTEKEDQGKP
jgi:type II secretory pathway predicted ATPase ExeA